MGAGGSDRRCCVWHNAVALRLTQPIGKVPQELATHGNMFSTWVVFLPIRVIQPRYQPPFQTKHQIITAQPAGTKSNTLFASGIASRREVALASGTTTNQTPFGIYLCQLPIAVTPGKATLVPFWQFWHRRRGRWGRRWGRWRCVWSKAVLSWGWRWCAWPNAVKRML